MATHISTKSITQQDIDRFMSYVEKDPETEAWLWTGGITRNGYGAFWHQGKTVPAHRFSYEIRFGPINDGLFVCHKHEAFGRHNVNPDHLFLGTAKDNMVDASLKLRIPRGTNNKSSKITPEIARAIANSMGIIYLTPFQSFSFCAYVFSLALTLA